MSEISWGLRPDFVKCYFFSMTEVPPYGFFILPTWVEEKYANDLFLSNFKGCILHFIFFQVCVSLFWFFSLLTFIFKITVKLKIH